MLNILIFNNNHNHSFKKKLVGGTDKVLGTKGSCRLPNWGAGL